MRVRKLASSILDVCENAENQSENVYYQSQDRRPIITPHISGSTNDGEGQQYLLIPNKNEILIKSMEHGKNICALLPEEKDVDVSINTVTILKLKMSSFSKGDTSGAIGDTEWVVVAGCSSGLCYEWSLSMIPFTKTNSMTSRRSFNLDAQGSITHMVSPFGESDGEIYGLVENDTRSSFMKFTLSSFQDGAENSNIKLSTSKLATLSTDKDKEHKNGTFTVRSMPFALATTYSLNNNTRESYIGICHKKGVIIYSINANDFFSIPKTQSKANICAFTMSPKGDDIALGYTNGKIDLLMSVLSKSASEFLKSKRDDKTVMVKDRTYDIVSKTIHWHALPVKTISYLGQPGSRATPSLLSGGEEAVLVTWSIDRGLSRPTHTLPRIAKGCISHIVPNLHSDNLEIVVKSMDDSLQLIQGHNHSIRWKIQGLGCNLNECVEPVRTSSTHPVALHIDARTQTPVLTGLQGVPGLVNWFDPKAGQVIGELEVASYNRISRKETNHKVYPRPEVTHFAMSHSGNDLITIDSILSENKGVGKPIHVESYTTSGKDLSEELSSTSTIKFWSWSRDMETNADANKMGMPYEMVAAMPHPHGLMSGSISALAISSDGNVACSLSIADGFFHVWNKVKAGAHDSSRIGSLPSVPSWKRFCKIAIPAGYSDPTSTDVTGNLVAFSPDSSVLAVAVGKNVTLWDHTNGTLLNTVSSNDIIQSVQFVRSPMDMLLVQGEHSLSLLPPFGSGYLGTATWSCNLFKDTGKLQKAIALPAQKEIAVVLEIDQHPVTTTKVVILDIMTGKAKRTDGGDIISWDLTSSVQSVTDVSNCNASWRTDDSSLLVLTLDNQLLALEGPNNADKNEPSSQGYFALIENKNNKALTTRVETKVESLKRMRHDEDNQESSKRMDIDISGAFLFTDSSSESTKAPLSTFQLPSLNSSFVRSFVGRHISK